MRTKQSIEKVVDYIETHLHLRLTVDELAEQVGFSKYHLNRVFSVYTGHSLINYVRKRKLSHAIVDLQTEQRIIDIAATYAYSSERAFSRAFLKEFGKSPSHFRNKKVSMTPKLTIYDLTLPVVQGENIMSDYLSTINYKTIPAMTVIRTTVISKNPEDEVIKLLTKFAKINNLKTSRNFGFDVPVSEEQANQDMRGYEYWLVLDESELEKVTLPFMFEGSEISSHFLDKHRYAALRISDPFSDPFERIGLGWKTLVRWLEEKQISHNDSEKMCHAYCLEEVIETDGITYMDIFIPVD